MLMHHRGTTDTKKSPKQDRCVWATLRNQVQKVRDCTQPHSATHCCVQCSTLNHHTTENCYHCIDQRTITGELGPILKHIYTNSYTQFFCNVTHLLLWIHSAVTAQLPQTSKQWKSHRWLPLWEVQEDESTILKNRMSLFEELKTERDDHFYRNLTIKIYGLTSPNNC